MVFGTGINGLSHDLRMKTALYCLLPTQPKSTLQQNKINLHARYTAKNHFSILRKKNLISRKIFVRKFSEEIVFLN